MKCFTIDHGQLTTGIMTTSGPLSDSAICVGECGKNRCMEVIPFFRLNPPLVGADGRVSQAHPVQPRGNKFFTLAKPRNEDDRRVIVRVLHYDWTAMRGSATEVGFGFGTSDEEKLDAYWYDSVLVLTPGTVLFLKAQCDKTHEYVLEFTDGGEAKLIRRKSFTAKMRERGTTEAPLGAGLLNMSDTAEGPEQGNDDEFVIIPDMKERSLGKRLGSS